MKGRVVISLSGHDIGRFYLVLCDQEKSVLVSDGKEHRLNKPKLKNKKHISQALFDIECDPGEFTDGKLRKFLKGLKDKQERIMN